MLCSTHNHLPTLKHLSRHLHLARQIKTPPYRLSALPFQWTMHSSLYSIIELIRFYCRWRHGPCLCWLYIFIHFPKLLYKIPLQAILLTFRSFKHVRWYFYKIEQKLEKLTFDCIMCVRKKIKRIKYICVKLSCMDTELLWSEIAAAG